jgi:multiple sugar transport system substrate-binding protein
MINGPLFNMSVNHSASHHQEKNIIRSTCKSALLISVVLFLLLLFFGCYQRDTHLKDQDTVTLVFKHGKIAGSPELFKKLLEKFEVNNYQIKVRDETLPASTDEQHQFYVMNLESRSYDFDVFSMDIIWVPEFARAGWLRDLSHLLPKTEREEFFPGPLKAVTYRGRIYAVPWYVDAGLLYFRKDLLQKYGLSPPKTWKDLVDAAQYILSKENGLYGFIWQGKQYEGLVCNTLEYLWSNGGEVLKGDEVTIDSTENIFALQFMRDIIVKYKVTPSLVTTATEETTRHIFGNGKAVFMRNWPYAWNVFEQEGSAIKGKVGVAHLPSFAGNESTSTLGGWQLGVNRYSKHPEAAEKLVRFLTSAESQKTIALTVGYKPARKSLYKDQDLLKNQPFFSSLYEVFMNARPRPVTPYYMMMTQVLQPEFSAVISGIRTPEQALKSSQRQINYILGVEKK